MSRHFAKFLLLTAIPASVITSTQAQDISRPFENTPYSRYGLGEEVNGINPALKAMGSIGSAYSDPYTINTENPASYATLKYTTYEGGGEGRTRTIIRDDVKYRTGSTSVSYLTIGIPMGKYAGMAIGFRPQTKVNYNLSDTVDSPIGKAIRSYNGDGGTNYFFLGAAGKYKGLSLGANVGYFFGRIQQSSWFRSADAVYVANSEFSKYTRIGSVYFKLGALYEQPLRKDYMLRIGSTLNLNQNINSQLDEFHISHPAYASDTTGSDTVYNSNGKRVSITMPMRYSLGVHLLKGDRWMIGADYAYTNWSQYKNPNTADSIGSSAYKLALGMEYTPNSTSLYNYWQRVTYRLGGYYGRDFVSIQDYQMNYYALSFGLSMPFKRSQDRIHASMEIGKIGDKSARSLEQNFIRFSLGVSFSDRTWFVKRKYE